MVPHQGKTHEDLPAEVAQIVTEEERDVEVSNETKEMEGKDEEVLNEAKEMEKDDAEVSNEGKDMEKTEENESPRGVLDIVITGSESDHSSIISSSGSSRSSFNSSLDDKLPENKDVSSFSSSSEQETISDQKKKVVSDNTSKKKSVLKRLSSISLLRWKFGKSSQVSEEAVDHADDLVMLPKPSWRNFTFQELEAATNNFNPAELLGKGGHAEVYKGCLPDGQVVAVKKITKKAKKDENRVGEFLSELGIIAHINHPNAAKLIGFSIENGLYLVLQFAPNGSLATLLHGCPERTIEWSIRFKVAIGVADGLKYLHSDCQRRIIHRDITASNILLSEDYVPQISDFGLAKWLPEKWMHHVVSPIEGTFGYMAPEYFMHGIIDEKTDVFAFGVLLLELITGRCAVDSCRQSLVMWAKSLLEKNSVKELADPRLGEDYDMVDMKRAIATATTCLHHMPKLRPNMTRVAQLLRGENGGLEMKQRSMVLVDDYDLEDYTCTTYLKDLNRYKQLLLE
ncbi:receptor-like cytosolic serine/threonine-protein kinase RBK1 isoform X2 [Daucus carota subsp. sativus]|uniref:non-specific serine/threonine protein kinase n=1 Tax=Daucus carota subsp. sativus TaxID=79200 RepID=A0A166I614_DAUCS|nr:PREDICTED: receptor-like cytosolic serine/threonine-protein kinase RBK1 isoform X2 [Daucus carota subsp. sativus]